MAQTPRTADRVPDEAQANDKERAAASSPGANVIVLAEDATLLELVKHALDGRQRIWRADSEMHAADLLVAGQSGILFLDAALTMHETPGFVDKLHEQFPDVPIVVTGRRDDEAELGQRISNGAVFRFLHKPVSADRVRNFIDAAARRLSEAEPASRPRAPRGSAAPVERNAARLPRARLDPARLKRMARAVSLLALLGIVAWALIALVRDRPWERFSLPTPTASAPTTQRADGQAPASPPAAALRPGQVQVARLLSAAGIALSQGRLAEPEGQNAIELYRAVLRLDAGNAEARQGLASTAQALLKRVDDALLAGDPVAAASALDQARSADPANPQLADYSARLEQARQHAEAADRAPTVAAVESADRAQSRQVARFLDTANARMQAGKLSGGPDSAESYVLQARNLAPDAPAVQQALTALSGRMLLAASEARGRGDLATASSWLDQAATLGVDGPAIARLRAEIASSQVASAQEDRSRLLALANQRIAQGRLLSPPDDSARHYIDLLRAADPGYAGLSDTEALLASSLVDQARSLVRSRQFADVGGLLEAATAAGARAADVAAVRNDMATSMALAAAAKQVLPESALQRISHDPPRYPKSARERGIQGWVNVRFTVAADGSTRDIEVTASDPPDVFDDAVTQAISRWRYQPHVVAGHPVDQRVEARLRFELAGH